MNKNTTAAQPLDLDKLQSICDAAKGWQWESVQGDQFGHLNEDGCFYDIGTIDADQYSVAEDGHNETVLNFITSFDPTTVDALIAKARAARLDTTASASGDKRYCSVCGVVEGGYHQGECLYIGVVTAAECRAAQPVPAGEAVDEHQMIAAVSDFRKATYEFARGQDPEDHGRMREAQKRIFDIFRATLAPVAAQQAAAKAPAAQAVDAVTLDSALAAIGHINAHNGPGRRAEAFAMLVAASPASTPDASQQGSGLRIEIQDGGSGSWPIGVRDAEGDLIARFSYKADAERFAGIQQAAAVAALSEPVAEMWAIYYDNLGKEPYTTGFMRPWNFYESKVSAAEQIETWKKGEHYKAVKVFVYAAPTAVAATTSEDAQTQAARDVLAERRRQVEQEGWTPDHDDQYQPGTMARAAACYATINTYPTPTMWPWAPEWWKPREFRDNYVRAAALLLAEIESIDRAALRATQQEGE